MDEHKKFTEAEMLVGVLLLTLPVDALSFLIDWTGIGLAIAPIIQSAAMFGIWLWLRSKGDTASVKLGKQLLRYLSNLLPLLPTVTIVFLIEVYLHNHPETSIAKVAQGVNAAKAGMGATGGAAARLKAARTAYREAPVDMKQIEAMERARAGARPAVRHNVPSPAGNPAPVQTTSSEEADDKIRMAA
ncbi:MAG: hypothetical protein Q7S84_04260 [bacterium]|nr:hypothetical protein [bacterium]